MKTYQIAVIAGDGIGPEIVGGTVKVMEAVAEKFGHNHSTHITADGRG